MLNQIYDSYVKRYEHTFKRTITNSTDKKEILLQRDNEDTAENTISVKDDKFYINDEDIKIFNLEMTGSSPNSCTILLQYFASLYNAITKSNEVYEDSGNVIGVNYDKEDNEIISKFEKLDFNEKLDLFSEIIIKYDNEIYFDEKITMLSFDSELSGFDIAKQIKDFKN